MWGSWPTALPVVLVTTECQKPAAPARPISIYIGIRTLWASWACAQGECYSFRLAGWLATVCLLLPYGGHEWGHSWRWTSTGGLTWEAEDNHEVVSATRVLLLACVIYVVTWRMGFFATLGSVLACRKCSVGHNLPTVTLESTHNAHSHQIHTIMAPALFGVTCNKHRHFGDHFIDKQTFARAEIDAE